MVIALFGSIIWLIASSVSSHVKTIYDLYGCFDETVKYVAKNIKNSVGNIKLNKSFNLNLENIQTEKPYFSSLHLSNDAKRKHMNLSIKNLNLQDNIINLNTYISNDDVGFYFDDNPETCYSASSNNFRTKWNGSIYSKIYTIPEFIPDDLNYDKVTSLITGNNLLKSLVALNFGNINTKPAEIVNNVRISKYQQDENTQNYHMAISKDYIVNIFDKLKKSSDKAYFKALNPYITTIDIFLNSSVDKTVDINFVARNKIIRCAETSIKTENGIYNITVNIDKIITVTVKELSKNDNLYYIRLVTKPNRIIFLLSDEKSIVITGDLKRLPDSLYTAHLACSAKNGDARLYKLSLSNIQHKAYEVADTKNIYSMSLAELFKLYNFLKGAD